MFFRWMKQYMPRGLYGRAALILVLPVVLLQILVSVVFIQRHFDGVTNQMTAAVSIELLFLKGLVDDAASIGDARSSLAASAGPLKMASTLPSDVPMIGNDQLWSDFTGGTVRSTLMTRVPSISKVSLADRRNVTVWIETNKGPLELSFARRRVSASNPHQLLVIMGVMGALMTAIAYFFLRNQLRPIKRMAAAAQAYGKGRITRFTPTGAVEVRAAGTAFLDMRNRIERQNQSRTMMLSGISHDLRTPLTRLRLGLSLMPEEDAKDLVRDVEDMQALVDSFLDYARADATDAMEDTDPSALLKEAVEGARRSHQSVEYTYHATSGPGVKMRTLAIKRALENLLNNAARYADNATARVQILDRAVVFAIEDDGPGIPETERDAAARPFVRLDPARNQDQGSGVGLGLAIVSDIARSHGGMLRLGTSETLGGLKAELVIAR